jgi:hypothetical protein
VKSRVLKEEACPVKTRHFGEYSGVGLGLEGIFTGCGMANPLKTVES